VSDNRDGYFLLGLSVNGAVDQPHPAMAKLSGDAVASVESLADHADSLALAEFGRKGLLQSRPGGAKTIIRPDRAGGKPERGGDGIQTIGTLNAAGGLAIATRWRPHSLDVPAPRR
jgi:hypothetical protein